MRRPRFTHSRRLSLALVAVAALLAAGCGGAIGPTPAGAGAPVLPRSLAILGITSGVEGDQPALSAVVTFTNSTTLTVTPRATWTSTNEAVATVTPAGLVTMLSRGECDVKASYTDATTGNTVSATAHLAVSARPPGNFALTGVVTDRATGQAVPGVFVVVSTGANTGHFTNSGGNGFYSLVNMVAGSFVVHYQRDGYDPVDQAVTMSSDAVRNVQMSVAVPGGATNLGTYAVTLTTTTNSCSDITPGASGTIVLTGTKQDLTITVTERDIVRTYRGSMDANGVFAGSGTGLTNIKPHDFTGGISGTVQNTSISGTEGMTITLGCPNGIGSIVTTFVGTKQ
jgi:hypothetical protein